MALTSAHKSQITLPKLSIDPNSRVQVLLDVFKQPQRTFQGEFLGVQHYDFFMVRMTLTPGIKSLLSLQLVAEIRYGQEGAINSFRTELLSFTYKPSLILFFAYPDKVSVVNIRKIKRLPCRLPVFIQGPQGDGKGLIVDISKAGCGISFSLAGNTELRGLKKDDKIIIKTVFSADSAPTSSTAIIKKIDTAGGCVTIGLVFDDFLEDFLPSLTGYCECIESIAGILP